MKKRIIAALSAAFLCLQLLPMGSVQAVKSPIELLDELYAAEEAERNKVGDSSKIDMETAYAQVLNGYVEEYGIAPSDFTDFKYYDRGGVRGLFYAELIDFDLDGVMELYLLYATSEAEDYGVDFVEHIWCFDGTNATLANEHITPYGFGGMGGFLEDGSWILKNLDGTSSLVRHNYMLCDAGCDLNDTIVDYKQGVFETVGTVTVQTESLDYSDESVWNYTMSINGNQRLSFDATATHGDVVTDHIADLDLIPEYQTQVDEEIEKAFPNHNMDDNQTMFMFGSNNKPEYKYDTSLVDELNQMAMADMNFDELKAMIPYNGDISKMNMSAEQAKLFSDIITQETYLYVGMFDAGNGIPAMWGSTIDFGTMIKSDIWMYDGTKIHGLGQIHPTETGSVMHFDGNIGSGAFGDYIVEQYLFQNGLRSSQPSGVKEYITNSTVSGYIEKSSSGSFHPLTNDYFGLDVTGSGSDYDMVGNWNSGADVANLLTAYAKVADDVYSYPNVMDDIALVEKIATVIAGKVDGKIVDIYQLEDGIYYVIIEVNGTKKGAVVRSVLVDGVAGYDVGEISEDLETPEILDGYAQQYKENSNVSIDFEDLSDLDTSQDFADYLEKALENLTGLKPNDEAKSQVVSYVETAIQQQGTCKIKATNNGVKLTGAQVQQALTDALETKSKMDDLLSQKDLQLNKEIEIGIRLIFTDVTTGVPIQITLSEDLLHSLQGASLQIVLDDGVHGFDLTSANLDSILKNHGEVTIQMELEGEDSYILNFVDKDGNVIDKISAPIGVNLPTDNEFSTIIANLKEGDDNWGGQFDPINKTIGFDTPYSGKYIITDNSTAIKDIEETYADEIAFMVSKGFFTVDEKGNFYPENELKRYDFTKAIVRMFFALDRELETSFTDVPTDSPYYDFVASAEQDSIVQGFDDGTFQGEIQITTEQVLALVARTLAEKKGYVYPENVAEQLSRIEGAELTSDWAQSQLALAVREGVVLQAETINPLGNVSREDAAVYLYRLFMLLEEVSVTKIDIQTGDVLPETVPEDVAESEDSRDGDSQDGESSPVLPIAISVIAIGALGGGGWFIWKKKNKGHGSVFWIKKRKNKKRKNKKGKNGEKR